MGQKASAWLIYGVDLGSIAKYSRTIPDWLADKSSEPGQPIAGEFKEFEGTEVMLFTYGHLAEGEGGTAIGVDILRVFEHGYPPGSRMRQELIMSDKSDAVRNAVSLGPQILEVLKKLGYPGIPDLKLHLLLDFG